MCQASRLCLNTRGSIRRRQSEYEVGLDWHDVNVIELQDRSRSSGQRVYPTNYSAPDPTLLLTKSDGKSPSLSRPHRAGACSCAWRKGLLRTLTRWMHIAMDLDSRMVDAFGYQRDHFRTREYEVEPWIVVERKAVRPVVGLPF